ncbi:TPA: glycoside hydrolase [Candidatus Sumerlaeota bacterium]|nr:glycoside hydrolase [Candidatus Sumerlaeota bacterium]
MKKMLLGLLASLAIFAVSPTMPAHAEDGKAMARNPIIWADVPDTSIIRVGDTYYMSSTVMHLTPGLPIMKSKDLAHWEMVTYLYDTLGDSDKLALRNGQSVYSQGTWASSLRQHKDMFYLTTFSNSTGKTYIYKTKDIEKGPWTLSTLNKSIHDHSLFFDDDGRVYLTSPGGGNISLIELTQDASDFKQGAPTPVIIQNASAIAGPVGLQAEGSQIHKINGKYYIFLITWPKGGQRTELVYRADKITGPYEGKVVLSDKGVAQGSVFDTPDGKWYALLFQDNGAVGRTPFLVPVKWEDGWPMMGVDGKVPMTLDFPAGKQEDMSGIVGSDEFTRPEAVIAELKKKTPGENDYTRAAFPLQWEWNHNPDNRYWSLTAREGWLRLTNGNTVPELSQARNMLSQRTFGPECSANTCIDVSNMKDGDFAGITAFQKEYGFVGVKMEGDAKSIVMVKAPAGRPGPPQPGAAPQKPEEVQSIPLTQKTVYLKVDCDFKNRKDTATFYYSLDGKKWDVIGKNLKMSYTLPHFMGYRFGLFNFATKTTGGFVDFDYYHVDSKITAAN